MKALAGTLVLLGVAMLAVAEASQQGVITATVTDQTGAPISGAIVQMLPDDGKPRAFAIPECLTDNSGRCSRNRLPLGKYRISAMKEEDGYPDLTFNLYGHDKKFLVAEITAEAPEPSISIAMGPKAASISIEAIDDITGKRIERPTVLLRRVADPTDFLSTSTDANGKVLVPPGEDILVEVRENGYEPWRFRTEPMAAHPNALHLQSEETRNLTIRLKPSESQSEK